MSATADVQQLVDRRRAFPGWTLLRSENAPVVLALLHRHFDHGTRRLPAPELYALLDADLLELREAGHELPRTGQGYCSDWVRAGFLVRRAPQGGREETLEPAEGAFAAIAFTAGLDAPASSVTESRLGTLSDQLQALARDSDPRAESRLAALHAERAELDRQIAAVQAGEFPVLDGARAVERSREILSLAAQIPGDFARVRADLEELNRALRAQILDDEGDRGDTLGDVFRGVDLIGQSDAGRSFTAFYDMILDPARSGRIDEWIEAVLSRPFADGLTAEQRRSFRTLLTRMEDAASEVHATMTSLSRSLRHFVQSRTYEEHRRMQKMLRSAQQQAVTVAALRKPYDVLHLDLVRIGMSMESVAALRLHNPTDDVVTEQVRTHDAEAVDLAELRRIVRESEIDFDELTAAVTATLRDHGRASVGDVLREHPASQGLASVVGLMTLAAEHGHAADGAEEVSWHSAAGVHRTARIPRAVFDPGADAFRPRTGKETS